jgi:hexosaminidase
MIHKGALVLLAIMLILNCCAQVNNTFNLMPVPAELKVNTNRVRITNQFRLSIIGPADSRIYAEASRFVRRLSNKTGIFLDKQGYITRKDTNISSQLLVQIHLQGRLKFGEDESYSIQTATGQVIVTAATDLGAIHGLETLIQLVSTDTDGYYFPGVYIHDNPRFAWRGLLLDVALHFMPVDVVKRTLDGMAAVKMNVLHLHLCNDQGFRVESKIF